MYQINCDFPEWMPVVPMANLVCDHSTDFRPCQPSEQTLRKDNSFGEQGAIEVGLGVLAPVIIEGSDAVEGEIACLCQRLNGPFYVRAANGGEFVEDGGDDVGVHPSHDYRYQNGEDLQENVEVLPSDLHHPQVAIDNRGEDQQREHSRHDQIEHEHIHCHLGLRVLLIDHESPIRRERHHKRLTQECLDKHETNSSLELTLHVQEGKYFSYVIPDERQYIRHDPQALHRSSDGESQHLESKLVECVKLSQLELLLGYPVLSYFWRGDFEECTTELSEIYVLLPNVLHDYQDYIGREVRSNSYLQGYQDAINIALQTSILRAISLYLVPSCPVSMEHVECHPSHHHDCQQCSQQINGLPKCQHVQLENNECHCVHLLSNRVGLKTSFIHLPTGNYRPALQIIIGKSPDECANEWKDDCLYLCQMSGVYHAQINADYDKAALPHLHEGESVGKMPTEETTEYCPNSLHTQKNTSHQFSAQFLWDQARDVT